MIIFSFLILFFIFLVFGNSNIGKELVIILMLYVQIQISH